MITLNCFCQDLFWKNGKFFTNHIVYTLATDPANMHIFGRTEDVMGISTDSKMMQISISIYKK